MEYNHGTKRWGITMELWGPHAPWDYPIDPPPRNYGNPHGTTGLWGITMERKDLKFSGPF